MTWQPIETAPQDGTPFQVWVIRNYEPRLGFWEPNARFNPETGAFEIWGRADYDLEDYEVFSHLTATHWMPLPDPPRARQEGEK